MDLLSEKEQAVVTWYDEHATQWANQRKKLDEPSFWAAEYAIFQSLQRLGGALLEIGSGSGREAIEFIKMGYDYFGIDNAKNLLEIARQTEPAGQYVQTSVYEMPFAPHTFDAFSSWAMLPHVPKERIKKALLAIQRVVKPGALGFIAMREGEGEAQEPAMGRWFSYYLQEEFEGALEHSGFEVVQKSKKVSRPDLVWLVYFVRAL